MHNEFYFFSIISEGLIGVSFLPQPFIVIEKNNIIRIIILIFILWNSLDTLI